MKASRRARQGTLAAASLAAISLVSAQGVAPATDHTKDEPVVLSPFEVGASADRGYQPTSVLQGGRGKIDLADVAGQVEVFTKDFMEDIGAVNTDETLLFSATTQTYYDNVSGTGDNRPGGRGQNPQYSDTASNGRGLGIVDRTRNFFRTSIDNDSYNLDRITMVSGANAVQFGLGGGAGTLEATTIRANLNRNLQSVKLRTDSYGSQRGVIDVSQVIIPGKLAIRGAGLRENKEFFLRPGFEENRRGFGTITYQPFKGTTLRVEGEYFYRRDNRPSTPMTRDRGYMAFLKNPLAYANRVSTGSTTGRPTLPSYTMTDGTVVNYSFEAKNGVWIWPDNGVPANFTGWQDVRNSAYINLGDTAAGAASSQSLMAPGYPWNTNPQGFSRYNKRRTRNLTGILEQRITDKTYLELGYSWEKFRSQTAQLMAANSYDVQVDINKFLPDGVTPNPMYGRAFTESNGATGQGSWTDYRILQYRATLTHDLDLTKSNGWLRYFGRHKLGLFASFDDTSQYNLGNNRFLIIGNPSFLSAAAQANPLHADRVFNMRFYLPPFGSTDDPFAYAVPNPAQFGDIMGIMNFKTLSGEPFQVTMYQNPVGFVGTTPTALHLQRNSGAASTSSSFFQNHLVANVGVRYDRVRNSDFSAFVPLMSQNPNGSGLQVYNDFREHVPEDHWTPYRTATRWNYGIVARPPKIGQWVSFAYDYSKNASLDEVAIVRDVQGNEVEPKFGESHEYSVRLQGFDNRVFLKVNYFDSLVRNVALADSGLRQNLIDFEQQLYANDPTYPINPLFKKELNPLASQFRLPSDQHSTGYEFSATFNPTRDWRFFANAGKMNVETDDISMKPWLDYLAAKLPVWQKFGGNWATAPYSGGQTVAVAYDALIAGPLDDIYERLGNIGNNAQTWRGSFVGTRLFNEGMLKGLVASVNFRYRGPAVIGFPTYTDAKGQTRTDRNHPYESDSFILTGAMLRYEWKGPAKTVWRVQLNANNIFDNSKLYVTRAWDDGTPRNYGRQPGREFILSLEVEH